MIYIRKNQYTRNPLYRLRGKTRRRYFRTGTAHRKTRTVLSTFETTRVKANCRERPVRRFEPVQSSDYFVRGSRNKYMVSRAHAVDIPFALPMSFELSGRRTTGRRDRGPGETAAREQDWHPAKRRCVIGVADGKCNTHRA